MAQTPAAPSSPAPAAPLRIGPDHRDLYLLVVGLIVGVILSPWVLGSMFPAAHDWLVTGGQEQKLRQLDKELQQKLERTIETQVSNAEVKRLIEQRQQAQIDLASAEGRYQGRLAALVLAIAALMVLETLLDPAATTGLGRYRARLATARYALLALWLALVLAQPGAILHTNALFVVLLIGVALVVAFVPLGWLRPRGAAK